MAMNEPVLKASIKAAFLANLPSADSTQIAQVDTMAGALASAFISCVSGATLTYTTGLVAPPSGGPVTGTMGTVVIS